MPSMISEVHGANQDFIIFYGSDLEWQNIPVSTNHLLHGPV